jgi:hypothetical protein
MFRTPVKIALYILACLDILVSLSINPMMALIKALYITSAVWAWKLY